MQPPEPPPHSDSLAFVEALYESYCADPDSVSEDWRKYFDQFPSNGGNGHTTAFRSRPSFTPPSVFNPSRDGPATRDSLHGAVHAAAALQDRVDQLVRAYRVRGHLLARLDPLGRPRETDHPELDPAFYGIDDGAMSQTVSSRTIAGTDGTISLRELLDRLRQTYCRSIGVQFMHIDDLAIKTWLQSRMESTLNRLHLGRDEQVRILRKLTAAVAFEEFIQKKYLGAKRFSLEGAESLIPLLDLAIEKSGRAGVEEIVLGMAHRGRLNVLANIMGKSPARIFREFEDRDFELFIGRGDVKYHLGYSHDWTTEEGKKIHLSLAFNPSHLEFVNPVVLGRTRAKQERLGPDGQDKVLGILIHGDAAFIGQGVVQETLNLSEVPRFRTGGTLHIIANNQIGFTTTPTESRSTTYASDIAKMLQVPIFHVNGEDPEAVAQVVSLAVEFRNTFHRDVVIDMYCYRRYGHNEGDEPAFTQPAMYEVIRKRKTIRDSYLDRLLSLDGVQRQEADKIAEAQRARLEEDFEAARRFDFRPKKPESPGVWEGYVGGLERNQPEAETAVPRERLVEYLERLVSYPDDFQPHRKIERFLANRREMASGDRPLDWATAEALAFASLAAGGARIRLSGQDSARGTFSQRNGVLHDARGTGRTWVPLQHVAEGQAGVELINSPLSEVGVLGFEYGYSLDTPDGLTLWEAQFGDFCNAAQVIIDQFLSSAEDKWDRLSGLTLLLPHGFEGQGPEHSSARLERFLVLAAEDNMLIAQPTTPAQYFHMLRRQVVRPLRKPLVVMTPKSLLRHPAVASGLDELATGRFRRVLADERPDPEVPVRRVLMCSGKIYYELANARSELERWDVAIIRLEQLYPLEWPRLDRELAAYGHGVPVLWVQEEPENMGAWRYLRALVGDQLFGRHPFTGLYRQASASPATGSAHSHRIEQEAVISLAFAGL